MKSGASTRAPVGSVEAMVMAGVLLFLSGCSTAIPATATADATFTPPSAPIRASNTSPRARAAPGVGAVRWEVGVRNAAGEEHHRWIDDREMTLDLDRSSSWVCGVANTLPPLPADAPASRNRQLVCSDGDAQLFVMVGCSDAIPAADATLRLAHAGVRGSQTVQLLCVH